MKLNELSKSPGARRKRVGRGQGSGVGKTCGRGMKGQKSRTGVAIKGFEGGQMPLYRRLPKRGFNNKRFATTYQVLNLGRVSQAIEQGRLPAKGTIDHTALVAAGLVRAKGPAVRLLGKGDFDHKGMTFVVAGASAGAIKRIEDLGGKITPPTS
ncbi:MAG: 50S ribosomal protein L15 [Pseudomonadota bacterium]